LSFGDRTTSRPGYGHGPSVNLVGPKTQKALTNADNYRYFIEDAFWPSVGWKF